jgi:hypothetical protein
MGSHGLTKEELIQRLLGRGDLSLAIRFAEAFNNGQINTANEDPDDVDIIVAGNWPTKTLGARQYRCQECNCVCSLTPKSQAFQGQNPKLPVICQRCFIKRAELESRAKGE